MSSALQRLKLQPVIFSGAPGSGKSTLLRHVASRIWHHPDELGLTAPYLPMLVPAYRLAKAEGSLEARLRAVISDEYALEEDLPQGFLSEWSQHFEAKWLLLIDGLEQVSQDKRMQFVGWLQSIAASPTSPAILLSCRSQSIDIIHHSAAESSWEEFEVCPLSPVEAVTLAANWIPTNVDKFNEEFERISDSDIRHTPLLTTIAALVFREKGALPCRRAQLYELFVDTSLREAKLSDLEQELDPRSCRSVKPLLALAAMAITMDRPSAPTKALGSWLADNLGFPEGDADVAATEFLEVMAERSGIFARLGASYDFVHSTFRHYLAASHFAHQTGDDTRLLHFGVSHFLWADPTWRECIVFLTGIVSERPERSDALIKHVYDQCKWYHRLSIRSYAAAYNVLLLAECLLDGAITSEATRQLILRALLRMAKSSRTDFTMRVLLARALVSLKQVRETQTLLPLLMRDSRMTHNAKAVVVSCFHEVKSIKELVEVACNSSMEDSIRRLAVSALGSLHEVEGLVEVLSRLGPRNPVSDKAFDEIFMLSPYGELERIAKSPDSGEIAQLVAVMLLGSFDQKTALHSIACDESAPIKTRLVSWVGLLREMPDTNALQIANDPQTRAKLQAPTLAFLEQLKHLWPEQVPSVNEEMQGILASLFAFVFGERNLLRDDCSNARVLIEKSISHIRGQGS